MSIPATELPSGVNATLLSGVFHEPRGTDRLRRGRVAETDRSILETHRDQTAIATKGGTDGRRGGGHQSGQTAPVMASRSLTVPSLPSVRKARPSGRNPPDVSSTIGPPIARPWIVSQS